MKIERWKLGLGVLLTLALLVLSMRFMPGGVAEMVGARRPVRSRPPPGRGFAAR